MKAKIAAALVAGLLVCAASFGASAQSPARPALVVSSCGNAGFPLGTSVTPIYEPFTMLQNGNLCTNGGGGGGGAVTGAAGSFVDGWSVTDGTKADSAYTGSGSASEIAILKGIYAAQSGSIPAGANLIGSISGSNGTALLQTTTGALEPPTAASGKITVTSTSLSANTNMSIASANASRTSMGIQCGSGGVNVSETGATLASATFGATGATIYIPAGTQPYFSPPVATRTAITAYTATTQFCVVTEYNR